MPKATLDTSDHRNSMLVDAFDFLLVFYSELRSKWDCFQVVSRKVSKAIIDNNKVAKYASHAF